MCARWSLCKSEPVVNDMLRSVKGYGRYPEWVSWCTAKFELVVNDRQHSVHWYGCVSLCSISWAYITYSAVLSHDLRPSATLREQPTNKCTHSNYVIVQWMYGSPHFHDPMQLDCMTNYRQSSPFHFLQGVKLRTTECTAQCPQRRPVEDYADGRSKFMFLSMCCYVRYKVVYVLLLYKSYVN